MQQGGTHRGFGACAHLQADRQVVDCVRVQHGQMEDANFVEHRVERLGLGRSVYLDMHRATEAREANFYEWITRMSPKIYAVQFGAGDDMNFDGVRARAQLAPLHDSANIQLFRGGRRCADPLVYFRTALIGRRTSVATRENDAVAMPGNARGRRIIHQGEVRIRLPRCQTRTDNYSVGIKRRCWIDPPKRLVFGPNHPFVVSFRC